MKWFKHMSDSMRDPAISQLIEQFGFEGYGRYWAIMELIADRMSVENNDCSASYTMRKWCDYLVAKPQKLRGYLVAIERLRLIHLVDNGQLLNIYCPKMQEYRDNFTKNLQVTGKSLASRLEVEVDKKKIREEKKEDIEASPSSDSDDDDVDIENVSTPSKKLADDWEPENKSQYAYYHPEPKDHKECNRIGKTFFFPHRDDGGGWFIPWRHEEMYLEMFGGQPAPYLAFRDRLEAWLIKTPKRWKTTKDMHRLVLNCIRKQQKGKK